MNNNATKNTNKEAVLNISKLNELRTQGIWEPGYGDQSGSYGIFTKKMLEEGLIESPICLISPVEKMNETDQANAKYICLAVNNFDNILDNLKRLVDRVEESNLQDYFPHAYKRAKEAIINASTL